MKKPDKRTVETIESEAKLSITVDKCALASIVAGSADSHDNESTDRKLDVTEDGAKRKFKLGDVVQLNSGGVLMTVVSRDCCGDVEVAVGQIAGDSVIYEVFPEECLKIASPDMDDEIPF